MAIAIIENQTFAPLIGARSTTTTSEDIGRRGPLASMVAMARQLVSSDTRTIVDDHELRRRRDQATIDHWMRSLHAQ